jgi:tetratricopeptide (TPR) repeat protein
MDTSAAQIAIGFALNGKWEEAVAANLEIIKQTPEDTDALNRLARAYAELGRISEARETAKKVIKIDPVNSIANKCIEKWKSSKNGEAHVTGQTSAENFLEEPGKTKLVTLLNLGDSKIFTNLDPGEEVKVSSHAHKVSINTVDGKYVGRLPDDIAARLRNLIKLGNKYQALVKSVNPKEVTIFMREVERGAKAPDTPSFATEKIDYVSFTPPELVHKDVPEMTNPEETSEE